MRATYRCSRGTGSARHNDRSFDLDVAPHINQEKTKLNQTWHCVQKSFPDATFAEAEKIFYEQRYSASLEATNARYRAQYHPERCKTIQDLLEGPKTRPEEFILQVGTKDEHPDPRTIRGAMQDFLNYLNTWNKAHGNHCHVLNFSLHLDEATPHLHVRRCWDYMDQDGYYRLGQEKALAEAGVELPDPDKKPSRYNNRKMTFDTMMREKWQDILKSHGLEIETKALPRRKHLEKEAYIDEQIAEKERKLERLEKQVKWTQKLRDQQKEFQDR